MVYSVFIVSWPYKDNGICFSVQCCFIADKEKEDISFFPYSKCMEVDQWYIARLSSSGLKSILVYSFWPVPFHSEYGKRRHFLFPYSKNMDVDQWYIARLRFSLSVQRRFTAFHSE